MATPYVASLQTGMGAHNGRPVVYHGSEFICEARDAATAEKIASALNAAVPVPAMLGALKQVSFYAHVNHGTKCKDYGEVVNGVLKKMGVPTGEL